MEESGERTSSHPFLVALRRLMKLRGVKHEDLEKVWGLSGSTVRRRLHGPKPLSPIQVDDILTLAGVSRRRFYRAVASGCEPEVALDDIAARNRDQAREFVAAVRRNPPAAQRGTEALHEMATELEALRFRDAEGARAQALEILRSAQTDTDDVAEAWGVLGVLERYKGRPAAAATCLGHALRLASDRRTCGRTFQRIAMLLLFEGSNPNLAMAATAEARDCYWRCQDFGGLGRVLVDEGIVLGNLGAHLEAQDAHRAALRLLSDEDFANRFGAIQGLAVSAIYLRDVQSALERLDQAEAMTKGQRSNFRYTSVIWLRGELALLRAQYHEAIQHFLKVWDLYVDLELGPLETGLVSLRMAKCYAIQGDYRQVRRVLREILLSFGEANRPSRLLGSAFGEFLRESGRGQVSAESLEEIYRKVRGEAQTAPPLLPVRLTAG